MTTSFGARNRDDDRRLEVNAHEAGLQFVIASETAAQIRCTLSPADAWLFREWLNGLSEGFFEAPPRWAEGDIVRVTRDDGKILTWVRDAKGTWRDGSGFAQGTAYDSSMIGISSEAKYEIIRQASGQGFPS